MLNLTSYRHNISLSDKDISINLYKIYIRNNLQSVDNIQPFLCCYGKFFTPQKWIAILEHKTRVSVEESKYFPRKSCIVP
jgi:hypothetical protein